MSKINYYLKNWKNYEKVLKTVLIVAVIAVVLFFGGKGEKEMKLPDAAENVTSQKTQTEEKSEKKKEAEPQAPQKKMYADISGSVNHPGIYPIREELRLFELIEMAGGLTADADNNGFNQAEVVLDGDKIIIPSKNSGEAGAGQSDASGKVNLNLADKDQLQEIPGVGPSTAEKIIQYRTENGRFHKKEDLMNISGIGEKTYAKLEGSITV